MKESEIDEVERTHNIKFTKYHRAFLKILHTIDRKERIEYTKTFDKDAEVFFKERSYFYNWYSDIREIKEELDFVYKNLLNATKENRLWLKSWGVIPESIDERSQVFVNWYKKAPKLIPIHGHRFVISQPENTDNAILSIAGTDAIIYGVSMKDYLLNELKEELGLYTLVYNKDEDEYDEEQDEKLKEALELGCESQSKIKIPVWKEFLIATGVNEHLI